MSTFIPSSYSEQLALIQDFCIDFVSYELMRKWLLLKLATKPFW